MSELSLKDKEYLEALLAKDPSELAPGELLHLHARREYLSEGQRKFFNITDKAPKVEGGEGEDQKQFLTVKEARKKLKELDVEFDEGLDRTQLNDLLNEKLAELEEEGE